MFEGEKMKWINGGRTRTRTLDPLIKRLMLLLMFQSVSCKGCEFVWFKINWLETNCKGHEFNIRRRFEGTLEMPVLRNPRHEKFAQEIAKAKTATAAMAAAGYSDPRNSTRLTKNDEIRRRIEELKERGAARAEVSVASLLGELEEARLLALKLGQASAAVAATMGKAKICGLIVDRREVGDAGAFDDMTDEELVREATRMARELGIAGLRLIEDDNKKPR